MRPDFALEDPATFNAVLPWSHFNSAGGKSSRDVASSKLLQEKVNALIRSAQHTDHTSPGLVNEIFLIQIYTYIFRIIKKKTKN